MKLNFDCFNGNNQDDFLASFSRYAVSSNISIIADYQGFEDL
ncbi:Protein CBG26280 [Caenorhabditis briggsae]|uniref:Protein CBG26280 n=1 Tax=Caenorhabditis briggsae TaxID=6238 RepID=B6IJI5_CAEBR|nr:Protein CBG26280 [Caenorhabditis briggsae]CAS00065.1 Protein CBG26280 [Caenorhabditis briggsae]